MPDVASPSVRPYQLTETPKSGRPPRPAVRGPSEPAGLIMTVLQRYADQVPTRGRREQALAAAIDREPGGRAKVQNAVQRWRAMPLERRIAKVGRPLATANVAALDESALTARMQIAFRTPTLTVAPGTRVRARTVQQSAPAAPLFTVLAPTDPAFQRFRHVVRDGGGAQPRSVGDAARGPGPVVGAMPGESAESAAPGEPVALGARGVPLYQLEFAGIYAHRETSWDQGTPHDEVYACFTMMGDNAKTWARRSAVYDKMDDGDDWKEDPAPCVLYGPAPAPAEALALSTLVMENDFGDPNKIAELWRDAAQIGQCVAKYLGADVDAAVADSAADLLHWIFDLGDDNLGADSVMLHPEALAYWAGQPLQKFKVQLWYHFFLFHTDNDARYYTFYRVRKVA